MKRIKGIGIIALALLAAEPGVVAAQSARSTPAIQSQYQQAITAIEQEQYIRATQLLTRLIALPEHVHSARAQELLGNVREANGQLAHAVAEYRIYLQKYPEGAGASRVSARLNAILSGAAPEQADPAVVAEVTNTPPPRRVRQPARSTGTAQAAPEPAQPTGPTVTERGYARLNYRYNEGTFSYTELNPDPIPTIEEEESDVLQNSLTASVRYSRVVEDEKRKVTLAISASAEADLDDSDGNDFRLGEAYFATESKATGGVLTFGRHRLKPSGIAYRLDGISYKWPTQQGPQIGLFAGSAVASTRDDLFDNDAFLFGASATFSELGGKGDLSVYFVEERDDDFTLRRAIGAEYDVQAGRNYFFANAEYDLQLEDVNRVLLTGTHTLENNSRITARLAHYRSPALSLNNALIGQTSETLEELQDAGYTDDEIEQLAKDRSSKVTTFGLTYYGKINDTWSMSAWASLYDTSGRPASGGVAAVEDEGVRTYAGLQFTGRSLFKDRDQLRVGLRFSKSDEDDYYLLSSSMRLPVNDKLTLRPRIRLGYRDYSDGDGDETSVAPSLGMSYKINDKTNLDAEIGGRWSRSKTSALEEEQEQLFLNVGLSRRF